MQINILQYNIIWENKEASKSRISKIIESSKSNIEKNSWIILPETTLTGFSMDAQKTLINSDDIMFFKTIAKKYSVYLSYGASIDNKNTMTTLNPTGDIINEYSKIHLFTYAGEDKHYTAGQKNQAGKHFTISDFKILPGICYDLRFSYLFWPYAKQTDAYVIIANWPKSRRENWKALLKARAIENQSYVIGVNRIGTGDNLEYSGDSMIFDPVGNEVLDCKDKEGLFSAKIDKDYISMIRKKFPFLDDRIS